MLIEVKVRVARVIDGKTRKRTEAFIVDKELFAQAEYAVTASLSEEQNVGEIENFEIQSLRISPIKEVCVQWLDNSIDSFVATLRDTWLDDQGNEKALKYKVLLWASDPSEALSNTLQLARQGYDMQVEGIKQVDYVYLIDSSDN